MGVDDGDGDGDGDTSMLWTGLTLHLGVYRIFDAARLVGSYCQSSRILNQNYLALCLWVLGLWFSREESCATAA